MKKILFIAAVALAAAACSKTYNVGPESQKAIGFDTWAETMTKAYSGSWTNGDAFKVYGTKTVGSTTSTVFDGDVVTYDGTKWGYTNTKYWDLTATNYTFYAFLPAAELASGTTEGVFTSKEITFSHPTENNEDVLVATKKVRTRTTGTGMSTADVDMAFNHMASLVDIKVKKDKSLGDDVTINVTAATLKDILNKGTLSVTGYPANKPQYAGTYGWTPDATPSTTDYAGSAITVNGATEYVSGSADSNDPTDLTTINSIFASHILMPQALNQGQKLVLSYTLSTSEGTIETVTDAAVELIEFVKSDNTSNTGDAIEGWLPGYHYYYYVTIGAKAITFTASVNDWDTVVSGYNYLVK